VIELFFQGTPPLPPELQLVWVQRRRDRPFDVATSGLGTCPLGILALRHDLGFPANISCDGTPARSTSY